MVKEYNKIYSSQISLIFSSSLLAMFFGIGSYLMYNQSKQDTIFASLIGTIFSILIFEIYFYIFSNNKYETIFKLNNVLFGNFIGNILNVVIILSLLFIACIILYNMSSFLNLEYLPDLSIKLLESILLLTLVYVCSKSLPQILRVNQIFCFVSLFNMMINLIGLFPKFDIKNLEPLFSSGKINFLKAIFTYVVLSIVPYFMILISSKSKVADKKNLNKRIIYSVVISNLTLIGIILFTILILGRNYITIFRFPEYIALKQFGLFNMVERVENVLSLQLYFNAFSLLMFIISMIKTYLPKGKYDKYYHVLIIIILYFLTNFLFKDNMSFISKISKYIYYVILIGIFVPTLLTFIKLLISSKRDKI